MSARQLHRTFALSVVGFALSLPVTSSTLAVDCGSAAGPDVIVGDIFAIQRWGELSGVTAYSYGPVLCNVGDVGAVFQSSTNQHPVSAQALYQWRPHTPGASHGSFRQIGISWAGHHFFALSNGQCCNDCQPTNGSTLGVNCSSPDGAAIMGSAFILGPRSEVNPVTGDFPANHASPTGPTVHAGRLQVLNADLDQAIALNSESRYFGENLIVSPDDAAMDADNNNASYREIAVNSSGVTHNFAFADSAVEEAAITAWLAVEPGVHLSAVDIPGDGRFLIASSASDEDGDGTWRYEYAVFNMNSAEATAQFTVPAPAGVNVSGITSHDSDHHSGEIYDTGDWTGTRNANNVQWAAPAPALPFETNTINWGLMHSFGFDADAEPSTQSATLSLYASGGTSPAFTLLAPGSVCVTDINGDGVTDTADLGLLIGAFGTSNPAADLNGDNTVDTADLGILIGVFGTPCP